MKLGLWPLTPTPNPSTRKTFAWSSDVSCVWSSGCNSHRPAGSREDNEDGKQGEREEGRGGERREAKEGRRRGEKYLCLLSDGLFVCLSVPALMSLLQTTGECFHLTQTLNPKSNSFFKMNSSSECLSFVWRRWAGDLVSLTCRNRICLGSRIPPARPVLTDKVKFRLLVSWRADTIGYLWFDDVYALFGRCRQRCRRQRGVGERAQEGQGSEERKDRGGKQEDTCDPTRSSLRDFVFELWPLCVFRAMTMTPVERMRVVVGGTHRFDQSAFSLISFDWHFPIWLLFSQE